MTTLKVQLYTNEEPLIFEDLSSYINSFTVSSSHLTRSKRIVLYLNKALRPNADDYVPAKSLEDVWSFFNQFEQTDIQTITIYKDNELVYSVNGEDIVNISYNLYILKQTENIDIELK